MCTFWDHWYVLFTSRFHRPAHFQETFYLQFDVIILIKYKYKSNKFTPMLNLSIDNHRTIAIHLF